MTPLPAGVGAGDEPMNDQASVPNDNFEHARQLIPAAQTVPAIRDPYGRLAGYGASVPDESEPFGLTQSPRILAHSVQAQMAYPQHRSGLRSPECRENADADAALYFNGSSADRSATRQRSWRAATLMRLSKIFDFMQTQYQLLQSRAMAERVASRAQARKGRGWPALIGAAGC